MSTKDLILQTAIDLFNELGTARVSTNLIAKQAGISPGNLYYHFTDKAHIIREIFELMAADWDRLNETYGQADLQFADFIRDFIRGNFKLLWRYRFYSRETVPLINTDPILLKRHVPVINAHFDQQCQIMLQAVDAGIVRFPDPAFQAIEAMTISWIVANQYLIHLESLGKKVEKVDFEKGADLVMNALRPYLTHQSGSDPINE